ncbi:hypothetical protein GCM10020331_101080 [Ectobacillus funiculus]
MRWPCFNYDLTVQKYVVLIDDCYTDLFTGELVRPQFLNDAEWDKFITNILKKYGITRKPIMV